MASPAQITANRINAQSSTGPLSAQGKAKSSQNAVRLGLFSKRDFVSDDSRELYEHLCHSLLAQLQPATPFEEVFAREIVSASWRLERCAQIEADLDPAQNEPVARARTAAFRVLCRAKNELCQLQTERFTRQRLGAADDQGIAIVTSIAKGLSTQFTAINKQFNVENRLIATEIESLLDNPEQPERPVVARNAQCPCGSGAKYKRCCGARAPLTRAA